MSPTTPPLQFDGRIILQGSDQILSLFECLKALLEVDNSLVFQLKE